MVILSELRLAARSLARAPLLAAVAIVSLGLGIGANATIFSFVNAVLFRPLPFQDPAALVDVSEDNPAELCAGCGVGTSWPTFRIWQQRVRSLSGLGAYREGPVSVGGDPALESERASGGLVTANLLPLLGVRPLLGRLFDPGDDRPGAPPVVLLGHGLWSRRYGADSAILGRAIRVNGVQRTVVGVLPEGFRFPEFAALWLPLGPEIGEAGATDRTLGAIGRLAPGTSRKAAGAELAGIAERLAQAQPEEYAGWTARVTSLREDLADDTSTQGFLLALAASGFVLLIACANLANLFLARATSRARELAVRVALGASRGRIAGHVLAESALLGLGGGVLGLVLSLWGVRLLTALIGSEIPFWIVLGADWRLAGYTAVLALLTGVAFGAVPAWRAARSDLQETLKTGSGGLSVGRQDNLLRGGLTVAQVALAIVLLAGAGVMVKSFLRISRTDNLGYNPSGVLSAGLSLQSPRYAAPGAATLLSDQLLERVGVQPMVDAVAVEHGIFLNQFVGTNTRLALEGAAGPVPMGQGPGHAAAVSPDYFRVMEIPLLAGRPIRGADRAGEPGVAVVNARAAALLWPGADPLGKRLRIAEGPWLTVVGVVGDIVRSPFARGPSPFLYLAAAQRDERGFRLLIRHRGDPATLATALKAVVRTLDPDEPVEGVATLEAALSEWVSPARFMLLLLGALSSVALLLASFGIYGVMSYLVARRARELGIRMALGAAATDLRRYVVTRGLRLALLGILIGLPAAFALARLLRGILFAVSPADPTVFAAVALLLAAMAVLACWAPARRATRVDPLAALRSE